jgi:protein dispatched 1
VAYGIYMAVFFLPFFPFLNLVGIFVVVGIGADDIFVFMDAWKQSIVTLGVDAPLEKRLGLVLYKACGSMFITSLTTASAFASNAFSPITSLKCFGVYCAIVVIVDFFLMLSYVPALVIIYQRSLKTHPACCQSCNCCTFCEIPMDPTKLRPTEMWFRDKFAPNILKLKFPLIAVFGGFAAFMGYQSTQLKRPTSSEFQLFKSDHPMEMYDLQLKDKFLYGSTTRSMKINFVMGVEGKDNGNHWDPFDDGTIKFMPDFDITPPQTQQALVDICTYMRLSTDLYIDPCTTVDKTESNSKYCRMGHELCPMELLKTWVTTPCVDTQTIDINSADCFGDTCVELLRTIPSRSTCCGLEFPITDATIFKGCVDDLTSLAAANINGYRGLGFWFDESGKLSAYTTYFQTNKEYKNPFNDLQQFYENLVGIKDTFREEASGSGGWLDEVFFTSDLDFFDLQRSLSVGAYNSAGLR